MAGRGDDQVVPENLQVSKGDPVDLCVGDDRGQITGRKGSAVGGQRGEVVHEVDQHARHRIVFTKPGDVGVLGPKQLLRELKHAWVVLVGQSEDGQNHLQRVIDGDVVGKVTPA